jgi:hypothetical protein
MEGLHSEDFNSTNLEIFLWVILDTI